MQDSTELLVTPKLFEQIVKADGNLVGIETPDVDETIAQFRQLAIRGGQAVYQWDPDAGISALREAELRVPGSKRLADALRFILQSMQFGVYLLRDFDDQLKPPNTSLLRRIARIRTGNERKLVFIARGLTFPDDIDALVERMSARGDASARPRLRDGRWVTA
ncbi:MAG: hypothetical protein J0L88_02735 [Xanthomonadales bacterium]|nr:hypothetical protein [Xanthomonadales bacterium]